MGVYKTDYWHGAPGILVLYEDGTSLCPSGDEATWEIRDNLVVITITYTSYDTGEQATYEEEAKIMENGLIYHKKFFEKVSG